MKTLSLLELHMSIDDTCRIRLKCCSLAMHTSASPVRYRCMLHLNPNPKTPNTRQVRLYLPPRSEGRKREEVQSKAARE